MRTPQPEKPWNRKTWAIGLTSLLACVLMYFAIEKWRKPRPIPLLGPRTETIVPGVHMIRGLGPSVCYVIETRDGPVLIDSGLEADAGPLKEEMARLLLDWHNIKAVLLTHVHGDHCGGAQNLRDNARARIHAGRGDAQVLRAGTPKISFFSAFHMPNHSPHKTEVDVELDGGEKLEFGDVTIEAVGTPGHTPGSICYLLKTAGKTLFFSGDVIMHLGNEKPLGTYSAYLAPKYRGDPKTYLESLKKMGAMPAPDLVLPGHPPIGPTLDDPKMTPERWSKMLAEGMRDMELLISRLEKDGADYLDGTAKKLLPGLYYLGDLDNVSVYAIAADGRVILIDAPGGPDLIEFVTSRLRSLNVKPEAPSAIWLTAVDEARTKGLKSLVGKTGAEVVASREGLETLKKLVPQSTKFTASEDLAGHSPISVKALTFRVGDSSPTAYLLNIDGKTVLISGRVPLKLGEEIMAEVGSEATGNRDIAVDTLSALSQLEPISPNLWLPSLPWHGQNANVYDHEWKSVIDTNYRIEHFRLRRANAAARTKGLPASPPSSISLP